MRQIKHWIVAGLSAFVLPSCLPNVVSAQDRQAQLDEASRLHDSAVTRLDEGQYDEAIRLAKRALEIREEVLGRDHPDLATSLNNLAAMYLHKADYAGAEPLFQRAVDILEKARGPEHPDLAKALSNLAALYRAKADNLRAKPLYRRALAIMEKTLDPKDPDVAMVLNNLAYLYFVEGDYKQAEPLYKRALSVFEKALGPDHPKVAMCLNNLGSLYRERGDCELAEAMLRRALQIREKAQGPEHPDVATALNNLASLRNYLGDYVGAEPLFRRALQIREKTLGPTHPEVASSLNNLALLYHNIGNDEQAELLLNRALRILETTLGVDHPLVAMTLSGLATLYMSKHDYARAEPLYIRVRQIFERALGTEHPEVATALSNLGSVYFFEGDYTRAERMYTRALEIREKAVGPEHPDVATSLNNLAALYQAKGDYARAEPLHKRALEIIEKEMGADHPSVATLLSNLVLLYVAKGDHANAIQELAREIEVEEHNLTLILSIGSESQKQLYLDSNKHTPDLAVWFHTQYAPQDERASRLALTAILERKGRGLDVMTDQIGVLRRHVDPQDEKLFGLLVATRSELAALQISNSGKLPPEKRETEVVRLTAEVERLEGEVSRRSAEFHAQSQHVTLDAVRQAIPADAALVEIFLYSPLNPVAREFDAERYVAYVARPDQAVPQWAVLGDATDIERLVQQLHAALRDPKREDFKQLARALDDRVMRPVRKMLGPTRHIFLAPDGLLNLIPFASLVDENDRYLIENYSISYLTSGRDLLRLQFSGESREPPAVFADPLYDLTMTKLRRRNGSQKTDSPITSTTNNRLSKDFTSPNYKSLPGTAAEAAALNKLFPAATVLTQARATEAALKQVNRPRFLHIATHGFFLADQTRPAVKGTFGFNLEKEAGKFAAHHENPLLRSGLIFAGVKQQASGTGEDGVLTALEVSGLDLWGTKLVVLSACVTGLGEVKNGEGVYGLRRALVLAGSETQVMSLWKVSDTGTRDLMTAYYTRLQKGEGRAEALRQVQLAMLRGQLKVGTSSGKRGTTDTGEKVAMKNYRYPYYWAAFIQSGDWRTLDGK